LASGFIGLTAGDANALVVNVGGQNYDVTTFTRTYNGNTSKFETVANGGEMPWWGSQSTANDFANAVNDGLGTPNTAFGPYFAYSQSLDMGLPPAVDAMSYVPSFGTTQNPSIIKSSTATYALAALVAPPAAAPSPLPIFGAAAAFGASRQLRKRIKRIGHSLSSTYGL
jgi:hypothetical protein